MAEPIPAYETLADLLAVIRDDDKHGKRADDLLKRERAVADKLVEVQVALLKTTAEADATRTARDQQATLRNEILQRLQPREAEIANALVALTTREATVIKGESQLRRDTTAYIADHTKREAAVLAKERDVAQRIATLAKDEARLKQDQNNLAARKDDFEKRAREVKALIGA